jgi:hypothetical protein
MTCEHIAHFLFATCCPVVVLCSAALALCSFISFLMNGPAAVLTSLAELDVVPPFDRPWMSTSLADFWSRCVLSLLLLMGKLVVSFSIVAMFKQHYSTSSVQSAAHLLHAQSRLMQAHRHMHSPAMLRCCRCACV